MTCFSYTFCLQLFWSELDLCVFFIRALRTLATIQLSRKREKKKKGKKNTSNKDESSSRRRRENTLGRYVYERSLRSWSWKHKLTVRPESAECPASGAARGKSFSCCNTELCSCCRFFCVLSRCLPLMTCTDLSVGWPQISVRLCQRQHRKTRRCLNVVHAILCV